MAVRLPTEPKLRDDHVAIIVEANLTQPARRHAEVVDPTSDRAIATAYNHAGDAYIAYADGDPSQLFAFGGRYGYGDRRIWELLDTELQILRISGLETVRVLDLGCGPGTWLRRVVTRARQLGFRHIIARGCDIAEDQVQRARTLSESLGNLPGADLRFEIGDIGKRYLNADASVDLCLCLCGVLNHLSPANLPTVFQEIARVTRGAFVTTVRAVGSTPTVYVGAVEDARTFRQDNLNDRLDIELRNGRQISFNSHLFAAAELRALATPHFAIKDILGLDLFHGRFAEDPRWNPKACRTTTQFDGELNHLENRYCREPEFIDRATHLLLVGASRKSRNTKILWPVLGLFSARQDNNCEDRLSARSAR